MNNKNILLILFVVVVAIQIFIPLKMIYNNEDVLKSGVGYKFKTRPIDPYDPFIGRYIVLRYDIQLYEGAVSYSFTSNQAVYAYLDKDDEGYAYITDIRPDNSKEGDYVRATIDYVGDEMLRIEFPFNRYYMREDIAKAAEVLHDRLSSRQQNYTYALISIKKGEGVIEGVYINEVLIEDYVDMLEADEVTIPQSVIEAEEEMIRDEADI